MSIGGKILATPTLSLAAIRDPWDAFLAIAQHTDGIDGGQKSLSAGPKASGRPQEAVPDVYGSWRNQANQSRRRPARQDRKLGAGRGR